MNRLLEDFLRGALVLLPVLGSLYTVWFTLSTIDGLVGGVLPSLPPGAGLVLAIVVVTLTGFVTRNVLGRRLVAWVESLMDELPLVRLLYGALRDMMQAFVGERKSFDKPAVITLGNGVRVLGFVTTERFDEPQLQGLCSVYLPQSYNFAGNLILVPLSAVEPVEKPGPDFLTFIVSGGVSKG